MQALPRQIADKFSTVFAGKNTGFSAREITEYFLKYSNLVKPSDHYGINPTRQQLFIESLYALFPKQQYYALNDLTFIEHESKYEYPSPEKRDELRKLLHNFLDPNPIGIKFSNIRETAFREDWVTCLSRVQTSPASAITAARTMLETLMKTMLKERGHKPEGSGDLNKLFKHVQSVLEFRKAEQQQEHQILTGLKSVINGISSISNMAGDRHGLADGTSIDDPYIANLCINSAGTLGIALIEIHLLKK